MIACTPLGQSGFRIAHGGTTLFIDPYLSDSVERLEGAHGRRQIPIWKEPSLIDDADWLLLTHGHLDHCDPDTVLPMAASSPSCRIVAPAEVCRFLEDRGIAPARLLPAPAQWLRLGESFRIHAVPAAHPTIELDANGHWRCVGYVIECDGRRIYHAGDTNLASPMLEFLERFQPIDTALIPVNEHNYFREQLGIVGNMGLRDAFGFAQTLHVRTLVPIHWDMFEANSVFREEIELYHRLAAPSFKLVINPHAI